MKFSEQWLREWVNPSISTEQLCAQLTLAGLEVDAVTPVAGKFSGVVVAEVLSIAPHPNAEKLKLCSVHVGQAQPLSIVCGASNVAAGLRVPCAMLGAELPGDVKIKRAKLRGVESEGMLCSAKELGLAESAEGLLILPADAPIGQDVREYLQCDDVSIELGLTPNRSDCLGVAGIAREAGVLNRCAVNEPKISEVPTSIQDCFDVRIDAPQACGRYVGRVVKGVNARAATPLWMQERLRRSGLRSISALVDVTNYVLLELGQPMHAFDLAKLVGGIRVRMAREGEQITLLDGQSLKLKVDALVIADERQAQALAGIMGGKESAVGDETRDIFLESAFFHPQAMAGKARGYGLHTDSSHRFERGVDFELQRRAIERATVLIINIAGGQPGPVVDVRHDDHLPKRSAIALRRARIARVLGVAIPDARVEEILTRLGMTVALVADGWSVTPPSFRFDIAIEVDLIEEIARIHGYNQVPTSCPIAPMQIHAQQETRVDLRSVRHALLDRGYQEVVTYSFVDPKLQQIFDPSHAPIALTNPIASDMAVMRTTLWPGLARALQHNLNRQQERARLFEIGLRFVRGDDGVLHQEKMVAGIIYGNPEPEQWAGARRSADFFDCKADVEHLLALTGASTQFEFVRGHHAALHPGQCAQVRRGGAVVGWVGGLHPSVVQALELSAPAYVFELDYAALTAGVLPKFRDISRFPSVRRDIAIVLRDTALLAEVRQCIVEAAPDILNEVQLFDVYQGKGIEAGHKSLALGLTFQALDRTLGDADVESAVNTVLAALKTKLDANLRS